MVKCGVLFEVRTEVLNIIQVCVGFKSPAGNRGGLTVCRTVEVGPKEAAKLTQRLAGYPD
jgi:hypothetical protein